MINLSSFVALSLYWALEAKVGYLCSSSQFIIGSVLSSVWVLSVDLMSFLWSSSFQIRWKAWFLLEGDKQKTKKMPPLPLLRSCLFQNKSVWPYNILEIDWKCSSCEELTFQKWMQHRVSCFSSLYSKQNSASSEFFCVNRISRSCILLKNWSKT